eukprot:351266-Chlamydomonas_euryale.AAC.3
MKRRRNKHAACTSTCRYELCRPEKGCGISIDTFCPSSSAFWYPNSLGAPDDATMMRPSLLMMTMQSSFTSMDSNISGLPGWDAKSRSIERIEPPASPSRAASAYTLDAERMSFFTSSKNVPKHFSSTPFFGVRSSTCSQAGGRQGGLAKGGGGAWVGAKL